MKKNNQAFTLIELLVSIFIFVTISILVIVNFRGDNQNTTLNRSMDLFIQNLRQMQNYALTCKKIDDQNYSAYGIYFTDFDKYLLFADKNDNLIFEQAFDLKLEENILEKNVVFTSGQTNITFNCPDSQICINAQCEIADVKNYNFKYLNGISRTVTIDTKTGRIEKLNP